MNVSEQKAEKLAKKMNKYLADSLAGLNLVLAILVILTSAFVSAEATGSFIGFVCWRRCWVSLSKYDLRNFCAIDRH